MYFRNMGVIPDNEIAGFNFIQFVNNQIEINPTISGNVGEDSKAKLKDVVVVKDFVCDGDKYNYTEMTNMLNDLINNVQSINYLESITIDLVYYIYFAHSYMYE